MFFKNLFISILFIPIALAYNSFDFDNETRIYFDFDNEVELYFYEAENKKFIPYQPLYKIINSSPYTNPENIDLNYESFFLKSQKKSQIKIIFY
ncbi:hypothetical protein HOK00_00840 [bacterium]|jgi:hypothetical protein|nr:hypothetical protein [bacterium]